MLKVVRKQKISRNIGGQPVPVYREGVDEQHYDELIRKFCNACYCKEENKYHLDIPGDPDTYYELKKNTFFLLLYTLLIYKEKAVVNGKNIDPFCTRLKTLLGAGMMVDRSGLSKIKKSNTDAIYFISRGEYPLSCSRAMKGIIDEQVELYKVMVEDWDNFFAQNA